VFDPSPTSKRSSYLIVLLCKERQKEAEKPAGFLIWKAISSIPLLAKKVFSHITVVLTSNYQVFINLESIKSVKCLLKCLNKSMIKCLLKCLKKSLIKCLLKCLNKSVFKCLACVIKCLIHQVFEQELTDQVCNQVHASSSYQKETRAKVYQGNCDLRW
jgi:hypothetical protein